MTQFDLGQLTALRHERHRAGAAGIHPYFGKLDPALARALIRLLSRGGERVLDPFCGSGTVLHEGLLEGRSTIGWDSSPLAVLLAAAKTSGVNEPETFELHDLGERLRPYAASAGLFREDVPSGYVVPTMPRVHNVSTWFTPTAANELAFVRETLLAAGLSLGARVLADTAFSRIIIKASNQQGESSYRRVQKPDEPGRVVELFVTAIRSVVRSAAAFASLLGNGMETSSRTVCADHLGYTTRWSTGVKGTVAVRDTRDARSEAELADLVVSSPPYLMSWDYGLYHKFRFYWLGFPLDEYEETEIGRHLRRKNDDVERYLEDMSACFQGLDAAVASGGLIALVNAPAVVYGKLVDTNALLARAASNSGWRLAEEFESLDIPGPHHGMYESLEARGATAPGRRGKRESVLVFERG